MTTFAQQVEYANSRGVGQLHIFNKDGNYERMSWRSWAIAKDCANRHGCDVVNDSGEVVYRSPKQ